MKLASDWMEVAGVVVCVLGLLAAYFHWECREPRCRRLARDGSAYCRKHEKEA